jgi:predicted transcriptional regulator
MLFDRPYNNIKSMEKEWKYARNTIRWYLRQLESKWIIKRIKEESDQPYIITEYLDILYKNKLGVKK